MKHTPVELTEQKKNALLGIYTSDGYQVILDIMEAFCNEKENEFIGTNPIEKDKILAQHAIMHAQRAFFQDVVEQIDVVANEKTGIKVDNRRLAEFENIVSALPVDTGDLESEATTSWLDWVLNLPRTGARRT